MELIGTLGCNLSQLRGVMVEKQLNQSLTNESVLAIAALFIKFPLWAQRRGYHLDKFDLRAGGTIELSSSDVEV